MICTLEFIMRYWLETAFGLVVLAFTSGFGYTFTKLKATHNGIKALLRHEIIKEYNYCKERDFCPIYALENMEDMYKSYKALGGNGTVTTLMKELHEMPRKRNGGNYE